MQSRIRNVWSGSPRRTMWLGIALIATTAVVALIILVATTETFASPQAVRAAGASKVCPWTDTGAFVSRRARSRSVLVPQGPVSLTVCRYGSANPTIQRNEALLAATGVTHHRAKIKRLVGRLDAVKPTPNEFFSCPLDNGSALLAFLRYPSGSGVVLTIALTGCQEIRNGHLYRMPLQTHVVNQLSELAKPLG